MKKTKPKKQTSTEIPIAAMCFNPGCKIIINMTKEHRPQSYCPKCGKKLEVWGIEVSAIRETQKDKGLTP